VSARRQLSVRVKLLALFGLLLFTGAAVLLLDQLSLQEDIARFNSLRDESLTGLRLAKSISDAYGLDMVDTTFRVRNNLMGWDQAVVVIETAQSDIKRNWQSLLASNLSSEQRSLTDEVGKARVIADQAAEKLLAILKRQDAAALGKFADAELYPAMDPVTTRLQFLADVKMLDADRSVREHLQRARTLGWWRILLSFVTLLFVVVVGRGILRNVYKGVESLVHLARHAREPDFAVPPNEPEGELGQIHAALLAMREDLLKYEANLVNSEARAQAANRAKSSFLASMSHEIRTPMVGVMSMLELLAQTKLDADQRQQIEIVQSSARSLLQIIGDILDFSKIEAGKLELNPAPVDLRQLVRDCASNFMAMASARGLQLECAIDERVGAAHLADALRLRKVLSNFLSNAIKFTERGRVQVRLERLAVQEQRELLAFRVRDSGVGISAEDQATLFQPFTQAGTGSTRKADSTGLGLSICRHLAELMGGEIALESELGVGTTMSLIVRLPPADPALIDTIAAAAPPRGVRSAPSVADAERERSLILLVDDHPTNRAVIARQVNQLGYACETANDGDAALRRWQSGRYALLLTDLHMPRRDGCALARAIRADEHHEARPRAPLIALSATVSADEVERSRNAGLDDFLAKPVPLAVLANTLQRYLPLAEAAAPVGAGSIAAPAGFAFDRELVDDFLQSTRHDLQELRTAIARGDAEAIAHESHRIKGASLLIGALGTAAVAERIEAAARAQVFASLEHDLAQLQAEVAQFAAAQGGAKSPAA